MSSIPVFVTPLSTFLVAGGTSGRSAPVWSVTTPERSALVWAHTGNVPTASNKTSKKDWASVDERKGIAAAETIFALFIRHSKIKMNIATAHAILNESIYRICTYAAGHSAAQFCLPVNRRFGCTLAPLSVCLVWSRAADTDRGTHPH